MTMTTIDVTTIPRLTHDEAMSLQAHELERTLAALRSLAWCGCLHCPIQRSLIPHNHCAPQRVCG